MPYTAPITRQQPTCYLILIDQSESMIDSFGVSGEQKSKAVGAADAVNRILENLLLRCTKGPDDIRDYLHVGVLGYGPQVMSALKVPNARPNEPPPLVPISQLIDLVIRLEVRERPITDPLGRAATTKEAVPIYVDPIAANLTPMSRALELACKTIEEWINAHPTSFPPTVINITDGEASDGSPLLAAQNLRSLKTTDGNVLLYNCHLSSNPAPAIIFPDSEQGLPDEFARHLFLMSSLLPTPFQEIAAGLEYKVTNRSRGFAFNAELIDLVKFLDIGTRPANMS